MFDSTTHQITTADNKVIVRDENGEQEEFVGMPFAPAHDEASARSRVLPDGRPIHIR